MFVSLRADTVVRVSDRMAFCQNSNYQILVKMLISSSEKRKMKILIILIQSQTPRNEMNDRHLNTCKVIFQIR